MGCKHWELGTILDRLAGWPGGTHNIMFPTFTTYFGKGVCSKTECERLIKIMKMAMIFYINKTIREKAVDIYKDMLIK